MDSIIWNNLIPDAGNEREGGNQMQLNATFGISAIWTEYMCYHYEMLLDSILKEKKIQLQLHVERERYDSLLKTQVSFLILLDIVAVQPLWHTAIWRKKFMRYGLLVF
ncbi:hypothetical protein NXW88_01995 [Bacteroides cellulosilyticus]|nr:hypothetical protein NXW88_01995 [Bacteroides cellulosilyticus]